MRQSLTDWRSLIQGDVAQARQAFRQLPRHRSHSRRLSSADAAGLVSKDGSDSLRSIGGEVVTQLASPTGFDTDGNGILPKVSSSLMTA